LCYEEVSLYDICFNARLSDCGFRSRGIENRDCGYAARIQGAEAYKKALDEINNLNKQLDAPALSAEAKSQKAKERDDKIANIKNMEREISDFRQTRERQLQEQAMRMREGIVKEITDVVMEKVKTTNMDLVFDKSGLSLNGVPVLMYSHGNVDFTDDIIAVLNKPGRATSSIEKTRTSPSPTPPKASRP
jgi:Skp family chaperone for outer membrane proteins